MADFRLRDLTAQEYAEYRVRVRDAYRDELVELAGHDPDEAAAKSDRDTLGALPAEGCPDTEVVQVAELDGRLLGHLWIGAAPIPGMAWVNDIEVEPEFRRQGYGRALMAAAEQIARGRGFSQLGLNVMGGNAPAIALYTALDYRLMHQQMSKRLDEA